MVLDDKHAKKSLFCLTRHTRAWFLTIGTRGTHLAISCCWWRRFCVRHIRFVNEFADLQMTMIGLVSSDWTNHNFSKKIYSHWRIFNIYFLILILIYEMIRAASRLLPHHRKLLYQIYVFKEHHDDIFIDIYGLASGSRLSGWKW